MSDSHDPKSPYSPNDPRNPRNPGDPTDQKNPFGLIGTQNPQESGNEGYGRTSHAVPQQRDATTLHPSQADQKMIQSSDIIALLQNKGKVTLNGRTLVLKEPSATDPRFQAMPLKVGTVNMN